MAIRWLHKGWKTFWKIVFTILLIVIILVGGALAILQLNATKQVITEKIENNFKKNYNGHLSIGDLKGFLPFNATLKNVVLTTSADSATADTLLQVKSTEVSIDLWALVQKKLHITHIQVDRPTVRFLSNGHGGYTLSHALTKKSPDSTSSGGGWIKYIAITAPNLTVNNGTFYMENVQSSSKKVNIPSPLKINDIEAQLFFELTQDRRYAQIENFSAQVQGIRAGNIQMAGQIYNDNQTLEFNAFHISAGSSKINLDGTIQGVDVYNHDLKDQLLNADFNIKVQSPRLNSSEFTDVFPTLPNLKKPMNFTVRAKGTAGAIDFNTLNFGVGNSYISVNGALNHVLKKPQLNYNVQIDTLALQKNDLESLIGKLSVKQERALQHLQLNGTAKGTADSISVNVSGRSQLGLFTFNGTSQLVDPHQYKGALTLHHFDIGPLTGSAIDTTNINFNADISGRNTSLKSGEFHFKGNAGQSFINRLPVDSLQLTTDLQQGNLHASYHYRYRQQQIQGKATADLNKDDPHITLNGNTKNVNLAVLFPESSLDTTRLNTTYKVNMQGVKPDRIQGMASFAVEPSVIRGDSVGAHKIKIELGSPDQPTRTLQVNSSLFDMTVTGHLEPTEISGETTYWKNYFKKHIAKEIRFDSAGYVPTQEVRRVAPVQATGHIQAKNLSLLKQYWPSFPSLVTNSRLNFSVKADSAALQFSSQIQSDTLRINSVQVKGAGSRFNGSFDHSRSLKESGELTFRTSAKRIESKLIKMDSVDINLQYARDSLYYSQQVKRFSKNARFNLQLQSHLGQSRIKVAVNKFFLGNDKYAWHNEGTPEMIYNRGQKFIFKSFSFRNQNALFALKGTLSPARSDSLQTIIKNVKLGRISNLLKQNFDFSGMLNGRLQTRSITRKPSITGNLAVDSLKLQDRLIGDVNFSSTLNKAKHRFDTKLKILTDSSKYQKYLKANNGIGQNIVITGYVKTAANRTSQDSLYHFNANFKEIDMWPLQLLIPDIFRKIQGRTTGHGVISGNLQHVNLSADFDVHHALAHPKFLETDYYLDGHIHLDKKNGITLDNIQIQDQHNGTGSITGNVDFTKSASQPLTTLNLKMNLNNLQFLNSDFNPDNPFYGSMAGTGAIRLSGPTSSLTLKSLSDIHIARNSTFALPLLGGTQLNTSNNFIKFVESFEHPSQNKVKLSEHKFNKNGISAEQLHQAVQNLSFSERFNIDLQFDAPDPINVRIIFDPVTEEELHARGTGRLRLTMNEGNIQIFGNFKVAGGSYNFVSGEIFSRKLDLRSGGNITWEGPPDDAQIDVKAVYHARPRASSLTTTASSANNASGSQTLRVPVDLVIELTGTLNNIQNNYHFEVPQTFASTSASTFKYRLNQINNDQQQKLLQATSILLTGNFLATGASTSQTAQLSSNLRKGSTFINPLLSNQVISPLLSNQINSLLNSDAASFDIDVELNQYNQIDLGVALRLYHDKVILRREGYLTGGAAGASVNDRIGDLKATYRINNNLSLTAFHRQDQTVSTVVSNNEAGDLTPTVNGAGVEAKVEFNTWQELGHKVVNFFRRLFGKDEIDFKHRAKKKQNKQKSTEQDQ